jgi:hypothetical protein|nr:MAG TPA: Protein of unknown function (DUF3970) [Caudoviricetes sp.]
MTIVIDGTPKEIAALVVEIQERQENHDPVKTNVYLDGHKLVEELKCNAK